MKLLDALFAGHRWYRKLTGDRWVLLESVDASMGMSSQYWLHVFEDHKIGGFLGGDRVVDTEVYLSATMVGKISDGYHTFDELYDHRCLLFAVLIQQMGGWKSRKHHDGSQWQGWFIAGVDLGDKQVTYHLPESMWNLCPGRILEQAPEWDGHTSYDTLERLRRWLGKP